MELSKTFSKICNIIFPFTDFMYLLQQEEYSLQRVGFWLPRFFFRRNVQKRDVLVYTQRVKITLTVAVLLYILANLKGYFLHMPIVITFIASCILVPFIVIIANVIVSPVFTLFKNRIIKKTHTFFSQNRGTTKVVAVTGSFGKTTVKNSIEQLVKASFKTQMIPGNINSTIGIADWILKHFQKGTEVLIVEMDSYMPKRIARSATLVAPDIAVITNVGDQHLQRYKTRKRLAASLFELFEFSPKDAVKITNEETLHYLQSLDFATDGIDTIAGDEAVSTFSDSHKENIEYASKVARTLGVAQEYIDHLSKNITLPDRRQSHGVMFGFDALDDSYNISFTTAKAGIKEAKAHAARLGKKLVVITAGIPELGPYEQNNNTTLGQLLDHNTDAIIILESIFAKEIVSGISNTEKIDRYSNFNQAIAGLQQKYKPEEWFVLVQPELTDLYY